MTKEKVFVLIIVLIVCINIGLTIFTIQINNKITNLESSIEEIKNDLKYATIKEFYDGGEYDESLDIVYDDDIYKEDE